jgi:hypothetical protein
MYIPNKYISSLSLEENRRKEGLIGGGGGGEWKLFKLMCIKSNIIQ